MKVEEIISKTFSQVLADASIVHLGLMWNETPETLHGFELHRHSSKGIELRKNVVYWNPNGRSSMISCAIKSFKRHSQGKSLFMVELPLEVTQAITKQDRKCMCQ